MKWLLARRLLVERKKEELMRLQVGRDNALKLTLEYDRLLDVGGKRQLNEDTVDLQRVSTWSW